MKKKIDTEPIEDAVEVEAAEPIEATAEEASETKVKEAFKEARMKIKAAETQVKAIINNNRIAFVMGFVAILSLMSGLAWGQYRAASHARSEMASVCTDGANQINKELVNAAEWVLDEPFKVIDQSGRLTARINVWLNFCTDTLEERVPEMQAARDKVS